MNRIKMTSDRWHQAKDVFCKALEIETTRRSAFLDRVCAGDEELRGEVESLLSAVEHSHGMFETPAGEWFDLAASDDEPPDDAIRKLGLPDGNGSGTARIGCRIGRYQIVKVVGQGGMGTVFKAVRADEAFEQQAAIKIVNRESASRDILRRFRIERQILAKLDHPNIGKLLDGGATDDGLPYFVMEYIEGTPITTYCDERKLPIDERLKLFRTVCAAVQYAHKNLIVHRDLKPSNILVTHDGAVKLLDFGIAKVLGKQKPSARTVETTQLGMRVLTPKYASPEQVRGESITTACDVYSLGVLLYELLTGCLPYRFKTYLPGELERVICSVEPDKPSVVVGRSEKSDTEADDDGESVEPAPESPATLRCLTVEKLQRKLAGDLDVIVLKALRKEPERRFSSVEHLSEDIRRHLEGLPVTARPDTLRYRTVKYVKRNKLGLAAAALVIVSLVSGIVISMRQAQIAETERIRAETEREKAERRFQDVRRLTGTILNEFHDAIQKLPGSTPARKLLIERTLEYYDGLVRESGNNPILLREAAVAYRKIGDVQGQPYNANLGDTTGALQSYRKYLDVFERLHAADPKNPDLQCELSLAVEHLGEVLFRSGESDESLKYHRRALEIRESLIAVAPDNQKYRKLLGDSYARIGDKLMLQKNFAEAMECYKKLIDNRISLVSKSNLPDVRRSLATAHYRFGELYRTVAHFLEAKVGDADSARYFHLKSLDSFQSSLDIVEDPAKLDSSVPNTQTSGDVANVYNCKALVLARLGREEEAIKAQRTALTIYENLVRLDPQNKEYFQQSAATRTFIADLFLETGHLGQALENYRKSQALYEKIVASDPQNAQALRKLAEVFDALGIVSARSNLKIEAAREFKRALALYESLCLEHPANSGFFVGLCTVSAHLGHCLISMGRSREAEKMLSEALTKQKTRLGQHPSEVEEVKNHAWMLLTCPIPKLRNPAEASANAENAVKITHSKDPTALHISALAWFAMNDRQKAERTYTQMMSLPIFVDLPRKQPIADTLGNGLAKHTSNAAVETAYRIP